MKEECSSEMILFGEASLRHVLSITSGTITQKRERMEKIILKCGLSPGDIVMLTAAVRDLHACYPNRFLTDVRTLCPDLWLHNPHVTPLDESAPDVRIIDCQYPLINHCNTVPCHCLQGFIDFLNDQLGLKTRLTAYKGDIHLSAQEKAWFSQVHEFTAEDTPFWIICAGGKHDVTIKWWAAERYQRVIDHFRGKILFVQVGQRGHYHPKLNGVLDLRGCTNLRMLVRLVYHAQGALCPVTCLMHLAAAVPTKKGHPLLRPCVVVAGGREPVHWELYPGHQFLHTIAMLPCCARTGCWRDRVVALGDGDERDRPDRLCVDVVHGLPRCLDLVTPQEVIRSIQAYYDGGVLTYLSGDQWRGARRGIRKSRKNRFDRLGLTSANARVACEQFIRRIPPYPENFHGRGVVVCAGGSRFFTNAWVMINMLRHLGCQLPIQLWHLGPKEMDDTMASLLRPLGVECFDGLERRKNTPCRILGGWELKCYAILNSSFVELLYLDADNVPVRNPDYLFETVQFQETGAVFWPDLGRLQKTQYVWELLGVERPMHPEFESGQILVNKRRCWPALALAMWLNENSDFFYRHLHGDKETFHLAFRKLNQAFAFIDTPVHRLPGTMCQHDFEGRRIFQHRNTDKWNLFANNQRVEGFWLEGICRSYLFDLQKLWTGKRNERKTTQGKRAFVRSTPSIQCGMISCSVREPIREETLKRLAETDWSDAAVLLELDGGTGDDLRQRQTNVALRLLTRFLDDDEDYLMFLEDDLAFNRHLRYNLMQWPLFRSRSITLASLYNPGIIEEACDLANRSYLVRPERIFGSQAFLISRKTVSYLVSHWNEVEGMQDIKISRLAGRLKRPLYYHSPSLVQHVGGQSTWGGAFHQATDFDAEWKSEVVIDWTEPS